MKKLLLFVFAAFAFAACEQTPIEEQSSVLQDAPETLTVGFEGDDTRIQLNDVQKTVWTKGDIVSVFYKSNANQKWKYDGETGARTAQLKRVESGTSTAKTTRVVVVYPYNKEYDFNHETCNICTQLPATQHYLAGSYGENGNIMVSSEEYNQFSLKSVYGWLKLQIKGDGEKVRVITFRGNNGEQVAGEAYIYTEDASMSLAADMIIPGDDNYVGGSLIFDDTIITKLSLDCGTGVTLSEEPTAFYIALPPQIYSKGFTVEIKTTDGKKMIQSTDNEFTINRNHIQPMTPLTFVNNGDDGLYIPDEILKKYLVNNYDDDGDGEISIAESDNITMVNCSGKGVADLTGLEACTNLTSLNCSNNTITHIYLPSLTKLKSLTIFDNPMEEINLNNDEALEFLYIENASTNAVRTDETGKYLSIEGYSYTPNLTLSISNAGIYRLDIPSSMTLHTLNVTDNDFVVFNCYENTALTSVLCPPTIEKLFANGCSMLEGIEVSHMLNLNELNVSDCALTSLDVTKNLNLVKLICSNNNLVELNIRQNAALEYLSCSDNAISSLYLKNNTNLNTLYAERISIEEINLSNNHMLTNVNLKSNANLKTIILWDECTATYNDYLHHDVAATVQVVDTKGVSYGYPYYIGQYIPYCNGGVVFEATNEGKNCKLVSVDETNSNWGEAKKWCSNYGTDWYLPAKDELTAIYDVKDILNATLPANGYTAIGTGWYWSSAEGTYYYSGYRDGAYRLSFSSGDWKCFNKDDTYSVRAVVAF